MKTCLIETKVDLPGKPGGVYTVQCDDDGVTPKERFWRDRIGEGDATVVSKKRKPKKKVEADKSKKLGASTDTEGGE